MTATQTSSTGVGKQRPAGQIRPAASFCTARELRMYFTFSNSLKFQSRRNFGVSRKTACGAPVVFIRTLLVASAVTPRSRSYS
jgi:hypothetical protein